MLDYAVLRVIWWLLLGVLLAGFAVMDGFDLGAVGLLPMVAKNNDERRVVINTVGPVWEGNQVWFILGGGAIFAAWPYLYAVSFSGFYLAMLLVLLTFIVRPVSFKYRSKVDHPTWRAVWDWCLCLGAIVAALTFGVAMGNVLQGVPFHYDTSLRVFYDGGFWALFNPFALLCGVISVLMILMHGAFYLGVKTTGEIQRRSRVAALHSGWLLVVLFVLAGIWVAYGLDAYALNGYVDFHGPSNPLGKPVVRELGAWMNNYHHWHYAWIVPGLAILGVLLGMLLRNTGQGKLAFVMSGVGVFSIVCTVGISMFPFILPSSNHPDMSLLVWDASSSHVSLNIMFWCAVVFMPIILAYTAWVFRVLRGPVTTEVVNADSHDMY
jgi:cytochrome d ubiquinol oxidase subunit II